MLDVEVQEDRMEDDDFETFARSTPVLLGTRRVEDAPGVRIH